MTNAPRARVDPGRRISLALVISVLVHLATLWKLPPIELSVSREVGTGPLIVQLTPPQQAPSAPPAAAIPRQRAQPPPRPAPPPPRPKAVERPRPTPPVIARKEQAPASMPQPRAPSVPPAARPAPAPSASPPSAPTTDLASYIEARRRARGDSSAPTPAPAAETPVVAEAAEDANARANRIAAANLGLNRKPTFGSDPRKGGGIFQITRMSYDYAEFVFFGWNKDIRRDTAQTIDVRKGAESDIRIAVIRRMIAIIREHENGDFVWESHRLERHVTLSARPRDNAGLEDFLWKEFFEDPRRPAQRP